MERLTTALGGSSARGIVGAILDVMALAHDLPWIMLDRLIEWIERNGARAARPSRPARARPRPLPG
jgi:hypothetical protein